MEVWGIWLIKQSKQQINVSYPGGTTKALDPRNYQNTSATYHVFFLFICTFDISIVG